MTVLNLEAAAAIAISLSVLTAIAWAVQQKTAHSGRDGAVLGIAVGRVGAGGVLRLAGGVVPVAAAVRGIAPWSPRPGPKSRSAPLPSDHPRYAALAERLGPVRLGGCSSS